MELSIHVLVYYIHMYVYIYQEYHNIVCAINSYGRYSYFYSLQVSNWRRDKRPVVVDDCTLEVDFSSWIHRPVDESWTGTAPQDPQLSSEG